MKERGPIFYDAERVRWRRTRRVLEITAILLTVSLAYFFVTIAVSVDLPTGLLPDTKPGFPPAEAQTGFEALARARRPPPARRQYRQRACQL